MEEIREYSKANNGRYPEEHVLNFIKEKLKSMPCRNQGYILDGFPNTLEEAASLFKCNFYLKLLKVSNMRLKIYSE